MVLSAFRHACRQILRRRARASRRPRPARVDRPLAVESLETRLVPAGTWTSLARLAPEAISTMLLLSDGTVMAQGGGSSATRHQWHRLTPSASGSYVAGTWSDLASMSLQRLYFGSSVLPDGRVFVLGGEYSGPNDTANRINTGEVYDPVANSWSPIPNFPQSRFGDNNTMVLPDGRILAGYLGGPQTYIYNPATNAWSPTGTKLRNDSSSEESWVKLPDDSILSYDIFSPPTAGMYHAQRYLPSTGQWVDAGNVPVALSGSSFGSELGPGVLLADGRAWFTGATGHTAFYTPATNTWTAGPDIPGGLVADDAPAAVLSNGHVLMAADTLLYRGPTRLFDFDPGTNTFTDVTPPGSVISTSGAVYLAHMLMLPTGQVLLSTFGNKLAVYTPDGEPLAGSQPAITSVTDNGDGSFTLAGTQLNGINEGAAYGDDNQMATNYPIVRLTGADGVVHYARTFNWSSTGVATGDTPVTTQFTLPADLAAGDYSLEVVANGVASDAVPFHFGSLPAVQFSVVASADTVTAGTPFTVTVTALDANGNPVPDYQGTVRFRSNDPQAHLPRRYAFTADDAGAHTFTVRLATAGKRNIVVRDTTDAIKGKATVIVTAAPAAAFRLFVSSAVAAGEPFAVTVVAVDRFGNTDTYFLGTLSLSTSDADPGVVLPADYTLQAGDQGAAAFDGLVLVTPGDQALTVTDPASGLTGSVTITVLPG